MQSSSPSGATSHHPSTFISRSGIPHPGALSGPSGGFVLDAPHSDRHPNDHLHNRLERNRLERLVQGMERSLPLPTSPRGYLLFLCWLILIVGGMSILALMSAQILETRVQLSRLNTEHTLIQERNAELVWLIARETNLGHVQRRLVGKGYIPLTDVEYVVVGDTSRPAINAAAFTAPPVETNALAVGPAADLAESNDSLLWDRQAEPESFAWSDAPGTGNTLPASQMGGYSGGWSASLAEGFQRWESLFWDNRPERPAQPARFPSSEQTDAHSDTGLWNWRSWLPADAFSSWSELLPWLND